MLNKVTNVRSNIPVKDDMLVLMAYVYSSVMILAVAFHDVTKVHNNTNQMWSGDHGCDSSDVTHQLKCLTECFSFVEHHILLLPCAL